MAQNKKRRCFYFEPFLLTLTLLGLIGTSPQLVVRECKTKKLRWRRKRVVCQWTQLIIMRTTTTNNETQFTHLLLISTEMSVLFRNIAPTNYFLSSYTLILDLFGPISRWKFFENICREGELEIWDEHVGNSYGWLYLPQFCSVELRFLFIGNYCCFSQI